MAITERTRAYETLVRHNSDGTTSAQHSRIHEILRDGAVINATIQAPTTITQAVAGGLNAVAVFGEVATATLLSNDLLTARVRELELQVRLQNRDIAALEAQLAATKAAP